MMILFHFNSLRLHILACSLSFLPTSIVYLAPLITSTPQSTLNQSH